MRVSLLFSLLAGFALSSRGQSLPTLVADTLKPNEKEYVKKPKFTVETDRRFFFFRNPTTGDRARTNVWGAQVGFLMPSNIKVGVGYYFASQRAGGQWDGYTIRTRRLSYGTVFVEPYYFRRKYWELSSPFEVGFGTARYDLGLGQDNGREIRRVWAVPLGAGVSFSIKLPPFKRFKPARWFGLTFTTGYRLTIQSQVPENLNTYNGLYYSVSPIIFLGRFYEDYKVWRKRKLAPKHHQRLK